jgi:hypothetical protein
MTLSYPKLLWRKSSKQKTFSAACLALQSFCGTYGTSKLVLCYKARWRLSFSAACLAHFAGSSFKVAIMEVGEESAGAIQEECSRLFGFELLKRRLSHFGRGHYD